MLKVLTTIAITLPVSAFAELAVTFIEGAPKDRFEISNTGSCPTGPATLVIDLSDSAGRLIFDTTEAGLGVEVFQPVEIVGQNRLVDTISSVSDGEDQITLQLADLPAGEVIAFTTDLDDQRTNSDLGQTRVSGAEIAGASITLRLGNAIATGRFGNNAAATTPLPACLS